MNASRTITDNIIPASIVSKGTGAQLLVRTLAAHGTRHISCVAGESYLAVLDALLDHPDIKVTTCRQEGGAAFMAESWGKLTGKPGICFVTRGPGACNASIGVHTAMQDSTPMILFMGQVGRADKGREAFQEIDVRAVFSGLAKWAAEIDNPARVPEIVARAFKIATTGRPGPVVIGLPEDMLTDIAEANIPAPASPVVPTLTKDGCARIKDLLQDARQPVVIIGGSGWSEKGIEDFASFASTAQLPVAASFRRQDLFNHKHKCYVGELGTGPNPRLIDKIRQSDLVVVVGARLDEICTQGYTLFDAPVPQMKMIHIHQSIDEIGKVYQPALGLTADVNEAAAALASLAHGVDGRLWAGWRDELRTLYQTWTSIDLTAQPRWKGANMTEIFLFLRENLPEDAIITTDAGNFSGWAQRYLQYGRPGRLLAPVNGAMGYAVPSAIGASLAVPDKTVLGLCGDGGFMMTGQELATAIHHGAHPVIMVCNNGMYGTIRMHQEKHYPGRVSATALTNPDFTRLAESYGAFAARVESAADFPSAWERARIAGKIALIEIKMDPAQLTTNAKI
ncbi:MAG: thiamine pyrophosphate-binding protein [Micavibrio aeruginosavorus]|uniref:Thiamine pyrophosphate-binding protein n=1 Tax=Micavibrio aeruginosavorus TaxID=349221 RepID=A0A7T5R411_9BACT|nr:MAG: thiamine pyrophosphate-binding protein [Micavibrio aeruginosavorus]